MAESFVDGKVTLFRGDCLELLPTLAGNSIDSCVTDPPYHLTAPNGKRSNLERDPDTIPKSAGTRFNRVARGFMGKQWDGGDIAFRPELWAEVLRVLKPGAYLLAMGGDRTYHRLACAIEDAGFEVRGTIAYIFGSGFPKSRNVSADLATFPRCSCGSGKEAGMRAKTSIPADETVATSNTDASVALSGAISVNGGSVSVESSFPLSASGASVGAKTASMALTGSPTHQASGVGTEPRSVSLGRQPIVQRGIKELIGEPDPVMLGSPDVAGVAESKKVGQFVRGVKAKPKALRDKMVGDQSGARATVGTAAISGDSLGSSGGPPPPLISPSTAAPCRVVGTVEPVAIVGSHARSTAVGSRAPTDDVGSTEVSGTGFADEPRHGFVCTRCGGVIKEQIPQGIGTALKPAMELICLARKPLSESSIAANVLKHGTGAINIEGCRIKTGDSLNGGAYTATRKPRAMSPHGEGQRSTVVASPYNQPQGRWPANLIHDGSEEVVERFPETGISSGGQASTAKGYGEFGGGTRLIEKRDPGLGDSGSAARFFYTAKADADDRLGSKHPTVKPVDLISYLVRLVTPRGGVVLDPFAGTGTTGEAAFREGCRTVLIEREPEYQADILRRMQLCLAGPDERTRESIKARGLTADAGPLFGGGSHAEPRRRNVAAGFEGEERKKRLRDFRGREMTHPHPAWREE